MTDSEILDWLEAHGCPIRRVDFTTKWIHTIGKRPALYKRRQYDSLREAVTAAHERVLQEIEAIWNLKD